MHDYDPNQPPAPGAGIFGLPFTPEEAELVLLPVPWDVTTSYKPGTSNGPRAILRASHQLDVYDVDLGEPWKKGIAMLPLPSEIVDLNRTARADAEKVIALGGHVKGRKDLEAAIVRVNEASVRLNEYVYSSADRQIKLGKRVGLIGGDHSTPWGLIKRLAEEHEDFGILHIDAHADLRECFEGFDWSHASIMHNVMTRLPQVTKLVQVGIRDICKQEHEFIDASKGRIQTFFDTRIADRKQAGEPWTKIADEIVAALPKWVYVSFDIDGLDPSFCPNTGTPVPGGLHFNEAVLLLRKLVDRGVTIIGFDLNEVAPGPEGNEWDANVGARLLYKLSGWMLESWE